MNQLRACLAVSGAFLLAALFGTAPPAHAQQDAWRATPPLGKTLMFVFRNDGVPVAARVPVFVNSVRVGELANGSFVLATENSTTVSATRRLMRLSLASALSSTSIACHQLSGVHDSERV